MTDISHEDRQAAIRYAAQDYDPSYPMKRLHDADRLALAFIKLHCITETRCSKCGKTTEENKSKYCGDGSDKNNNHNWQRSVIGQKEI